MFNSISWTQYLGFIVLLLIVYYIFIGVKFYSAELKQLFAGKRKIVDSLVVAKNDFQANDAVKFHFPESQVELFPSNQKYAPQIQETDDTFQQVQELTAALKEVIKQAAEKNTIKEDFILSLQLLIKKYSFLKGSSFLAPINNLIASECEKYGYIPLSAEERVMLWNE